jgi:hypothetical protein
MKKDNWKHPKRNKTLQLMEKTKKNMKTMKVKFCSSNEKREWKTSKRQAKLCSSDEKRGMENIKTIKAKLYASAPFL